MQDAAYAWFTAAAGQPRDLSPGEWSRGTRQDTQDRPVESRHDGPQGKTEIHASPSRCRRGQKQKYAPRSQSTHCVPPEADLALFRCERTDRGDLPAWVRRVGARRPAARHLGRPFRDWLVSGSPPGSQGAATRPGSQRLGTIGLPTHTGLALRRDSGSLRVGYSVRFWIGWADRHSRARPTGGCPADRVESRADGSAVRCPPQAPRAGGPRAGPGPRRRGGRALRRACLSGPTPRPDPAQRVHCSSPPFTQCALAAIGTAPRRSRHPRRLGNLSRGSESLAGPARATSPAGAGAGEAMRPTRRTDRQPDRRRSWAEGAAAPSHASGV
ncbi:hypothetical protein JOD57_000032 [Geodermatophilus bullaregiensis]|nr:hypothetical protein [Geodermatophilus bullaregiensis]